MQFVLWTGIVVLGLLTLLSVGMVFFKLVAEYRQVFSDQPAASRAGKRSRREGMRRVDIESLRDDRPPLRRAA